MSMNEEQRSRTLFWAQRFRDAEAAMPDDPPEDVDPLIWKAQREAYLAQARDLEEQASR